MSAMALALALCMLCMLAACTNNPGDAPLTPSASPESTASGGVSQATAPASIKAADYSSVALSSSVTERDADASYDEAKATVIELMGTDAKITGEGAAASNGQLTIAAGGTYILTGEYKGTVVVELAEDVKAQLVLAGVTIEGQTGPAILIREADKVFLTLAEDSANTLTDAETYSLSLDDENADAVIFSKADFSINGAGSLAIEGRYSHGIVSKDDLVITGGTITVLAKENAIAGKDAVKLAGGTLALTAGKHGIRSNNDEDAERGYVSVTGGDITITSAEDGINAVNDIAISSGTLTVTAGDDGIHTDASLYVTGGTIKIADSCEGLEGANIYIGGGDVEVSATDDGINAAGGNDASGTNGGADAFLGRGRNEGTGDYVIDISGGFVNVDAKGDGVDSNGFLVVSGGTLVISGPEDDRNGALDYNRSAEISGGLVLVAGSGGMAETFDKSSAQCSYMYTGEEREGGRLTLTDGEGNVLLSGTVAKSFETLIVSSPEMKTGETYTLYYGGKVTDADEHGFASAGTLAGGEEIAELEQTETTVGGRMG